MNYSGYPGYNQTRPFSYSLAICQINLLKFPVRIICITSEILQVRITRKVHHRISKNIWNESLYWTKDWKFTFVIITLLFTKSFPKLLMDQIWPNCFLKLLSNSQFRNATFSFLKLYGCYPQVRCTNYLILL